MSLLNRFFRKRNPIERYGGTDRLAKDISDICHQWTNSVLDTARTQLTNLNEEDRAKHVIAVHITFLTLIMRNFFKCAELWAPNQPQWFVDELSSCIVRHEWGDDINICNSMFASISTFIQAMIADEKEERSGKIDRGDCLYRACSRPFDLAGERLRYSEVLIMKIAPYYPSCVSVNRNALESINAVNKDGVYVG